MDTYNFDYDVLGVDTNGDTVTVGYSSTIRLDKYDSVTEEVIIDDHPDFDTCKLELIHYEKVN